MLKNDHYLAYFGYNEAFCVYSPPQRVLEVPHRDQKDPNDPPKTKKGLNIANFCHFFLTNLRYSDFTGFWSDQAP